MPNYNKIIVAGHLGKDPDLRYLPNGTPVCTFTMAVSERYKDSNSGQWSERPLWFKVKVWGKRAETVSQFLTKGSSCLVDGRFTIEEWTTREGKPATTFVIDNAEVTFLDKKVDNGQQKTERPQASKPQPEPSSPDITDDDVPF